MKKKLKKFNQTPPNIGDFYFFGSTTGVAISRLSCKVGIVHKYFIIPIWGYLYVLQQPNATLQKNQKIDIIIIDEMSLLKNTLLNSVYMCIKQVSSGINDPILSKVLLVVANMAQLPPICNHFVESSDNVSTSHIQKSPFWRSNIHFTLTTLI
jgi:hypothetical protein